MARYKVKIGSTDLSLPLSDIEIGWDSAISYNPDTDSEDYRDEIRGEMIINCARIPTAWGADKPAVFDLLVEASEECAVFQVEVHVECPKDEDTYEKVWEGEFTTKNWKIDLDKKTLTFKPTKTYEADCVRSRWTDVVNFYDLPKIEVRPYYDQYEILPVNVIDCEEPLYPDYCVEFEGNGLTAGDCEDFPIGDFFRFYHRFVDDGTCAGSVAIPPDDFSPWTLLSNDCPLGGSTWWMCPGQVNSIVYRFKNGRLLNEALEYMLSELDCDLTLVSDFFDINADDTAPVNAAYIAALEDLRHLVIFQKSDVKRHSASDPSTRPAWDTNFRDLLNDLKLMFNVRWSAKDGIFRLEHISYFQSQAGLDLTTAKYERSLDENTIEVKSITKFKYRDARATDYFKGWPIQIFCGEGEETKSLSQFYTDVTFALTTDGLEAVGDDGFFLMSTIKDGDVYRLKQQNRPLAWTELHFNYHRHDMPGAGKINNNEVTPLSIRKTRKAPRFSAKRCCDDEFNPSNFITTALGEGDVVTADWNIARDYLSPELIY